MQVQNREVAHLIGTTKYFQRGETEEEAFARIADALKDNDSHFQHLLEILSEKRFLPAGRVMVAVGATRRTTPYNCFVSGIIEDSMDSITARLTEALQTMRLGGGIGYDFSRLRPNGSRIKSLDSSSCGPVGSDVNPVGFMDLFDAGCATISSAGHRRGAQMGVLRVDHPDIRHFIRAKREHKRLTNFNVSVGVTDEFMEAVERNDTFPVRFKGQDYELIDARALWNEIMRLTWDYAEPGVLFLDTMNRKNNLWYCEQIEATNPCGEQPLPPYGACLLGSFNLTEYLIYDIDSGNYKFDFIGLAQDIPDVVRAMDNVIDHAIYPLPQQEEEAKNKRRMGLGVTGLANAAEIMGFPYGSEDMKKFTADVLEHIRDYAYMASIELAKEKGPFPLYEPEYYLASEFIKTLPAVIQNDIKEHGIRNSHLLSIAPTGTISLFAGNVSSGIEPVFENGIYERAVIADDGSRKIFYMQDFAESVYGVKCKPSSKCSVDDHVDILCIASNLVDSSVSKTCNVGDEVTFDEFKEIYFKAWRNGASGCTTFRPSAIRGQVLKKIEEPIEEGAACFIDEYGNKTCE